MKGALILFLLASLAFAGNPAQRAEGRKHTIIRRLTGVAACGLSMWDMAQSARHTGIGGITEANGILAGRGGRADIGRMAGIKIGVCVAPLVIGEIGARWHSSALTNLGLAGGLGSSVVSGMVVLHNQQVLNDAKTKTQPGTKR